MSEEMGGSVAWLSERMFGFIGVEGQADIFFHSNDLVGLEWDQQLLERRVKFSVLSTAKGPRAVNVRPAD